MNNPAFESQQFADQVQARREGHIRDQGSIVAQGLTGSVQGFMQGQQQAMQMQQAQQRMQLESMQVTGELALNEARRQSALEELQWARELHTTDMLALQKKAMEAQTQLTIAQANKAKDAIGITEAPIAVSEDERDSALASGMDISFSNGRPIVVQADPAKQAEAKKRNAARQFAKDVGRYDMIELGMQGFTVDFERQKVRPMTPAEEEAFQRRVQYRTPTQSARNMTADLRRLESLLDIVDSELQDVSDELSLTKDASKRAPLEAKQAELRKERESIKAELKRAPATSASAAPSAAPAAGPEADPFPGTGTMQQQAAWYQRAIMRELMDTTTEQAQAVK